ncbi:MAG: type II secretion system secretin GspD [Desulfatiglandaceae bacterium]
MLEILTVRIKGKSCSALLFILLFVLPFFTGCASMHEMAWHGGFSEAGALKKPASESAVPLEGSEASAQKNGEEKAPAENIQQTESHQVGSEKPKPVLGQSPGVKSSSQAGSPASPQHRPRQLVKEKPIHVELAFDNADLYEVLDATLYELFKVNYMVDPSLKAKVSFHISGDYTRSQFVNILNNTLQLDNLAIVRGPGDIFKIVRRPMSAGVANAPLDREGDAGVGDITRMIRLRYISSAAALKNVSPFMSRGAILTEDAMTNALIMTDTSDNIDKAAAILSALDVPYFKDISWRLFPVKEIGVSDLAKDLDTVFKAEGLFTRPGMDKGAFQIIPLNTMNALLVVSKWPSIMTLIGKWVNVMDHADNSGSNVFVYFVQNGSAKELADILKQVYGGSAPTSSNKVAIVKPVQKPTEAGGVGNVSGKVEIIPDETNNAIVIKASARDYALIKKVLQRLDIVPRQVLIDVMVAEVGLTGSLQYGVEWYLQGRNNGYTVQGSLDQKVGRPYNTPLGSLQGFSLGVYNPVTFLKGLMYALGSDGDVQVLSSPNILAVDNKEASIEVGDELPSVTGQITDITSGTTLTNTVQYIKTGILLKVTPHINSGGLVKMEISQQVSDAGAFNEALQSYTITNRSLNTSLVAKDGETIVLGGLIKSKKTNSQAGIPFLRKIPILGYLFGGGTKEASKTELIFLITPHVITNRTQADAITREFSERVHDLKSMLKERTDG